MFFAGHSPLKFWKFQKKLLKDLIIQGNGIYFEATVDINGQSFSGTGKKKKDAKKNCAINALKNLLNIEYEEQKLEMPKEEVDKTPKLEIPEPEEEEADNPSPDKRSKMKTPIKRELEIKEEVADNPSPHKKSKKVRNCSV